jgi:DNA-binding transcriptional MerR regulator
MTTDSDGPSLTIDELARTSGMTVRTLRAHQSRGLLPPPTVRARTGYYGPDHVARLELIKELQGDGMTLDDIRQLLDSTGGSTAEVLRFTRRLRGLFYEEERQIVEVEDLAERWGRPDGAALTRALSVGLLRDLGDGRFEESSPRLSRAAQELASLGVGLDSILDASEELRELCEGVAALYVDIFLGAVWKPFEAEGKPDEQWPAINDGLERLQSLAEESLLAMFDLVIAERIAETFGREVQRLSSGGSSDGSPATTRGSRGLGTVRVPLASRRQTARREESG